MNRYSWTLLTGLLFLFFSMLLVLQLFPLPGTG